MNLRTAVVVTLLGLGLALGTFFFFAARTVAKPAPERAEVLSALD